MAQQIIEKSIEAATQPGNAGAVGVVTLITGWSAYFELLTPIIGAVAGILGGVLTSLLIVNAVRKGRDDRKMRKLEREEKHLEVQALKKKIGGK